MKLKLLTVRKRAVLAVLICLVVFGGVFATYFTVKATFSPKPTHTIVIDAGHGGADVKKGQYVF